MQLNMLLLWTCSAGVIKLVWLQTRRGRICWAGLLGGLMPRIGAYLGVWELLHSVVALL